VSFQRWSPKRASADDFSCYHVHETEGGESEGSHGQQGWNISILLKKSAMRRDLTNSSFRWRAALYNLGRGSINFVII
jgi:hypothetical protein